MNVARLHRRVRALLTLFARLVALEFSEAEAPAYFEAFFARHREQLVPLITRWLVRRELADRSSPLLGVA